MAEQQQVEILRALARDARVIVMDEPTAALDGADTEQLHEVDPLARRERHHVLLISHFLREVLELADAVTVLRDGRSSRRRHRRGDGGSLVEACSAVR